MQKENLISAKIYFHKKHSTAKLKCFTCDFSETKNGISMNTSENVAESQNCSRVGSESAWDTGDIKCDLGEF